ncbi:MAG: hypothetical protein AB8B65_07930 [Kordia sp.]|uniref:hypothetical protein n=1 Tax=Kordia sp. TaxID=1965332 RepID=UPI003858BCE0
MSRFSYTYAPVTIIKLNHEDGFATQSNVKIYPSKDSEALIEKYKLIVKMTPEGFALLCKKQEEFIAQTVDEVLIIDGEEVIDKRITGYASTTPNRTFSNWLPDVIDIDLEFYAVANQKYKNETKWNNLALNDFVAYSAIDLVGTITPNATINERIQPDAIIQLNIAEVHLTTPATLTFEINKL